MEFGTVIDMEEKVMEEKMEGKKYEQMFMEEVSEMLFAINAMSMSTNALIAGLLTQSPDLRERATDVSRVITGDSSRHFEKALKIKEMREGINDVQR